MRKKARRLKIVKETLQNLENLGTAASPTYEAACATFLCATSGTKQSCSYVTMCAAAGPGPIAQCQPAPDPTGRV